MKLFSKDKSRAKDEKILYIFDICSLIAGIVFLVISKRTNITTFFVNLGVILLITFITFAPIALIEIINNTKEKKGDI